MSAKTPAKKPAKTAQKTPQTKCGFIALIGAPNAGKSTLMNQLVGSKIAIVTHKVQTTRARMRGIAIRNHAQMVFIDTPGLFEPKRRLDRAMVGAAWASLNDADVTLLLIDAQKRVREDGLDLLIQLKEHVKTAGESESGGRKPLALVLNKIDCVDRKKLLELSQVLNEAFPFDAVFMISAKTGDGTDLMMDWLAGHLPDSPYLYPESQISDVPLRLLCADITREKLLLRLHQELPYHLTVETTDWQEKPDGSVRMEQMIYVSRESHKGMVVGKGGLTIKAVSTEARKDMETVLDGRVHLFLQVKSRPGWESEPARYQELGLAFSKK